MRILVTGCAGFIGSHVSEALLAQGHTVIGVDNVNDYYDVKLKRHNLSLLEHSNFHFYEDCITNEKRMQEIFAQENIDKVCHLAARAGVRPSIAQPQLYRRVNIDGTMNLLECAREHNVKSFVFASSSSVYGERSKVPFTETDNPLPISPYAATKLSTEFLAHTYHKMYGMNITGLRFFTVYGPRGRPDMAPWLFTQAIHTGNDLTLFGDGSAQRDFTYIADIVQGVIAALDKELGFEIINLGNSQVWSVKDLIDTISTCLEKEARIKQIERQKGDVTLTNANIEKAKTLLGYNPQTSLNEGIKHFIDWYVSYHEK